MSEHTATITWRREGAVFTDNRYNRAHRWRFDGGLELPASSSPHAVRPPYSDPTAIDPEEAFVAALSSCHMLWFLAIAAKRGVTIEAYDDEAVGLLARDATGKQSMTIVTLRPKIAVTGDNQPSPADIEAMHHEAHEACFIASSVKTDVRVEPRD